MSDGTGPAPAPAADGAVVASQERAEVGAAFALIWTVPSAFVAKTLLQNVDGKDPIEVWDKGHSAYWQVKAAADRGRPTPTSCTVTVSVTKDGTPIDFPGDEEHLDINNGPMWETPDGQPAKAPQSYRKFSCFITPKETGVYVFTAAQAGDHQPTQQLTVTVVPSTLTKKRQLMIDTINLWMDTSISGVVKRSYDLRQDPPVLTDLFSLAHWTAAHGQISRDVSDANHEKSAAWQGRNTYYKENGLDKVMSGLDKQPTPGAGLTPLATSCGDCLNQILQQWGCDLDGNGTKVSAAFGISMEAMNRGFYVSALDAFDPLKHPDGPLLPKPGDPLVLRDAGPDTKPPYVKIGYLAHVCIVVSVSENIWLTADGGGGNLPDQEAKTNNPKFLRRTAQNLPKPDKYYGMPWKDVVAALKKEGLDALFALDPGDDSPTIYPKGLPCVMSTTDMQPKMVDGWVDLDRVPNWRFPWNKVKDDPWKDTAADLGSAKTFKDLWAKILGASKK